MGNAIISRTSKSGGDLTPVTPSVHTDIGIPFCNFRKEIPDYCEVKKIIFPGTINVVASSQQSYNLVADNRYVASLVITPDSNTITLRHPSGNVVIYDGTNFADNFSVNFGFSWVLSERTLYIYSNPEYHWQKSSTSAEDVQVLEPDATVTYSEVTGGNSGIITAEQYYNLLQKPISCEEVKSSGTFFTNKYFENLYPIFAFSWSSSGGKGPYTGKTSNVGNDSFSRKVKALLRYSGYWDTGSGVIRPVPFYGENGDYFYCEVNSATHRIELHRKLSETSTQNESYRISVEFILI